MGIVLRVVAELRRSSAMKNYATKLVGQEGGLKDYKRHGSTDFGAKCVIL